MGIDRGKILSIPDNSAALLSAHVGGAVAQSTGLLIKLWLGSLCRVLEQNTLVSHCLSSKRDYSQFITCSNSYPQQLVLIYSRNKQIPQVEVSLCGTPARTMGTFINTAFTILCQSGVCVPGCKFLLASHATVCKLCAAEKEVLLGSSFSIHLRFSHY